LPNLFAASHRADHRADHHAACGKRRCRTFVRTTGRRGFLFRRWSDGFYHAVSSPSRLLLREWMPPLPVLMRQNQPTPDMTRRHAKSSGAVGAQLKSFIFKSLFGIPRSASVRNQTKVIKFFSISRQPGKPHLTKCEFRGQLSRDVADPRQTYARRRCP